MLYRSRQNHNKTWKSTNAKYIHCTKTGGNLLQITLEYIMKWELWCRFPWQNLKLSVNENPHFRVVVQSSTGCCNNVKKTSCSCWYEPKKLMHFFTMILQQAILLTSMQCNVELMGFYFITFLILSESQMLIVLIYL